MTSRDTKCGKLNINKKSSALAFFLLFLFCGGFFGGCGVLRRHEAVTGSLEDAIEIAVDNFLTCRLRDNSDWFEVVPYLDDDGTYYINEDGLIEFFIIAVDPDDHYWVREENYHTIFHTLFVRHIEKDGKLFTWDDTVADYRLGKEAMLALERYGRLDTLEENDVAYGGRFGLCHETARYWFCPHDLSNYARHIGYYRPRNPPKLRCRPKKR